MEMFLLGVMVTLAPSLIYVAYLLLTTRPDDGDRSPHGRKPER